MIGIFLDIESNGLSVSKHFAIEIAFQFVDLQTQKKIDSYCSLISISQELWQKSDPKSLQVNGFSFEDVQKGKPETIVKEEIISLFNTYQISRDNAVFICQNPSFDRSFFSKLIDPQIQEEHLWPYHWLDLASMFWALCLQNQSSGSMPLPWENGISKNKIAKFYNLNEEQTPHKAMQGVEHLIECYFKVCP